MTATAKSWFQIVPYCCWNAAIPTWMTLKSCDGIASSGHRNASHWKTNRSSAALTQVGRDKGHIDPEHDVRPAHAVKPRRFDIVARDLAEELVEEKDDEPVRHAGHDESGDAVEPAELPHHVVEGQGDRLEGQHEAENDEGKNDPLAPEVENRECEAGGGVEDQARHRCDRRDKKSVEDDPAEPGLHNAFVGL